MDHGDSSNFCRLYVRGATAAEALALLGPTRSPREALAQNIEVTRGPVRLDVHKASDAGRGPDEDFLYWPVTVEAEWSRATPTDEVVPVIEAMLTDLWAAGIDAVAACDFEDQLPFAGGIKRPPSNAPHSR